MKTSANPNRTMTTLLMQMHKIDFLATGALCALLFAATAPAQGETIVHVSGKRDRGVEIASATATEITAKSGKKDLTVSTTDVASIEWSGVPKTFQDAVAAEQKGESKNAANLYKEASTGTDRAVLQQEAQYRAAAALLAGAETDASLASLAVAEFDSFLTAHADTFRTPAAMLGKGRAQRLADDAGAAIATLKELETSVTGKNWPPKWTALARLERGQAELANEQIVDARSTFQAAASAADAALNNGTSLPELIAVKGDSVIAQGETYVAAKDFDQALSFFARFADSDDQPLLQAAALAGRAEVLLAQAEKDSGKDTLLRQAQMAAARASVLATQPSTSAKAMFLQARVLQALGSERAKDSKARASAYLRAVTRYYRGTRWAKRAQEALGG